MLCIPHFHRSIINIVCVRQLLSLVHDGCLWLGKPISITDMLIHQITNFPKGTNHAKEFWGNVKEKDLTDKMKIEIGLIKKLRRYSIHSIQDQATHFCTQILDEKIMRKCHMEEALIPVILLVAQFANGV